MEAERVLKFGQKAERLRIAIVEESPNMLARQVCRKYQNSNSKTFAFTNRIQTVNSPVEEDQSPHQRLVRTISSETGGR